MLASNYLGQLGRLANQMFQYASLRGIAANRGYDFGIPPSDFKDEWTTHQLFEVFQGPVSVVSYPHLLFLKSL